MSSGSSDSDKLNCQLISMRIWTGTAFLQQWWKFKKRRVLSLQSCCVEPLQELLLLCNFLTNAGRLGGQYSSCQGFWLWSFVASLPCFGSEGQIVGSGKNGKLKVVQRFYVFEAVQSCTQRLRLDFKL